MQQKNAKTCRAAEDEPKKAAIGGTGDELDLLSLLIKGDRSKTIGEDGFDLELFDQDDNNNNDGEEQGVNKGKTTTAPQKAKRTLSQPKESSLSKAMKEVFAGNFEFFKISLETPRASKNEPKNSRLRLFKNRDPKNPRLSRVETLEQH